MNFYILRLLPLRMPASLMPNRPVTYLRFGTLTGSQNNIRLTLLTLAIYWTTLAWKVAIQLGYLRLAKIESLLAINISPFHSQYSQCKKPKYPQFYYFIANIYNIKGNIWPLLIFHWRGTSWWTFPVRTIIVQYCNYI